MNKDQLVKIIEKLQTRKVEQKDIEIKSALKGFSEKVCDTISAFSNQDNGGLIIFGVSEGNDFEIVGVYDAADLQKRFASVCENMIPKIRPEIFIHEINDKIVVAARIYPVDYELRPAYYAPKGKIGGSYIRVGDKDVQMTVSEIYNFDAYKGHYKDDSRVPEDSKWMLLNEQRLDEYLREVKKSRENLKTNVSDKDILELMGITKNGLPTLTGIMTFSSYPQSYFPCLTINAVVIPGEEIGDLGMQGERFSNNKKITGSIVDMLDLAMDFVYNNQKMKIIVNEYGKRVNKPEYPMTAVREALLNALVHRDYSIHSENVPITLNMYSNRIEITNPGGLFGRINIDSLGKIAPETRNGKLADVLEILHITENRYSGIPTMKTEMEKLGLSDPEFKVERGTFKTILYNTPINDGDAETIQDKIYSFCLTPRSREEIIKMSGMSRYYVINKIVKQMVDEGKLEMTIPESPQSKSQRFVSKRK